MLYRKLGRTGLTVSEIGFGGWGLGATMWRGVPDDTGIDAVRAAIDLGVTFIDTALVYGDGHSERLISQALDRRTRGRVIVATKVPPKNMGWPGAAGARLADVFPARHVVSCVETSLRNLGVEALDIEQFHVWHDAWMDHPEWDDLRETMRRLKEQGKVLHWGVSVNDHRPDTAARLLAEPLIETVQAIYNIFDRSCERDLFDLARAGDLGVIVRVPFDEGALTGAVRPDTVFPPDDWRHRYFRGDRKAEAGRRADALLPLVGDEAVSLPELALRFVLSRREVATVIPGMRRPEHAHANALVSDGRRLSDTLLERLRAHAWDKNWYGD